MIHLHLKSKIFKSAAAALSVGLLGLFSAAGYYSRQLPSAITAEHGCEIRIAQFPEISCGNFGNESAAVSRTLPEARQMTFSLFGTIPVKNVAVHEAEAPVLIAGGNPFGIKLLMDGVMVTALDNVGELSGENLCPAKSCGIEVGDVITAVDGTAVTSNGQLQEIIGGCGGKALKVAVNRDGEEFITVLEPVFSSSDHCYKGGMWVRDSIAGIGTLTFINKSTGDFAGLGHPICDSDTGEIVPISSGEAVPVEITEAVAGKPGFPGELRGAFSSSKSFGTLTRNSSCGVFGTLSENALDIMEGSKNEYKLGYCQDITTGPASVLTTICGQAPEEYEIEITSIDYNSAESTKNMTIHITDQRLIAATGGIVQGMSGSPIIQNGRIVGAVTHVFVADPSKGYAIFAENMLK